MFRVIENLHTITVYLGKFVVLLKLYFSVWFEFQSIDINFLRNFSHHLIIKKNKTEYLIFNKQKLLTRIKHILGG